MNNQTINESNLEQALLFFQCLIFTQNHIARQYRTGLMSREDSIILQDKAVDVWIQLKQNAGFSSGLYYV